MKLLKRSLTFQIQNPETKQLEPEKFCGDLYISDSLQSFVILSVVKVLKSEEPDIVLTKRNYKNDSDLHYCAHYPDNLPRMSKSFKEFVEKYSSIFKTLERQQIFIADLRFLTLET